MKRPYLSRVLPLIFLFLFSSFLSSCGDQYSTEEVKDYRLFVQTSDPDVQQFFYELIQTYNQRAGLTAISYVSNPDEANSTIKLVKGLRLRDKKVGWGQWVKETKTSGSGLFGNSGSPTRTVLYSMKVEFDEDYMLSRKDSEDEQQQDEIFKLFAHEVGHGFLFDHHPDPNNVMYFDVSGAKDYSNYFSNVRSFFGQ